MSTPLPRRKPTHASLARAGRMIRRGLRFRYPLCCVLAFALDCATGRSPGTERGSIPRPDGESCVPCGVLHRVPTAGTCPICDETAPAPLLMCPEHRAGMRDYLARRAVS